MLLLAAIDRLKLFGATREIHGSEEPPLTVRETAAGVASAGGALLRSAVEATKGLPAALDELDCYLEKAAADAQADLALLKSPLGKSLYFRRFRLASMLEVNKTLLDLQDRLDADPKLAQIFESLGGELGTEQIPASDPSLIIQRWREQGSGLIPANIRIVSIPFLCHFTRIENLPSILQHGIVPVEMCSRLGIAAHINDEFRFDRRTNTSSFSIGHPNARMLHKYRQLNPDADWVVLAVNVFTALRLETLFCRHNAADARISSLPDTELQMNRAFQGMFDRPTGYTGKARYNEPTDEQAEILIPTIIPSSDIQGIFFLSQKGRAEHALSCGNRAIFGPHQSEAIFGKRFDDSLGHMHRIIQNFDFQIDGLEREFRRDPRLYRILDEAILEETGSSNLMAVNSKIKWLR